METLTFNKEKMEKEIKKLKAIGDAVCSMSDEDIGYNEAIRQGIKEILLNTASDIEKTDDPGEIIRQLNKAKVVAYLLNVDCESEEEGTNEMNVTRWGLCNVAERTILRIEDLITGKSEMGV